MEIEEEQGFYYTLSVDNLIDSNTEYIDYYEEENESVRKLFNLEDIFKFQKEHRVEIMIEADCQYHCYINLKVWGSGLTTLGALVTGILQYTKHNK